MKILKLTNHDFGSYLAYIPSTAPFLEQKTEQKDISKRDYVAQEIEGLTVFCNAHMATAPEATNDQDATDLRNDDERAMRRPEALTC